MDEDHALNLAFAILKYRHIAPAVSLYQSQSGHDVYQDDMIETSLMFVVYILGDHGHADFGFDLSPETLNRKLTACYERTHNCYVAAQDCALGNYEKARRDYERKVVANREDSPIARKARELTAIDAAKNRIAARLNRLDADTNRPSDYLHDDWDPHLGGYEEGCLELQELTKEMLSAVGEVEKELREKHRIRLQKLAIGIAVTFGVLSIIAVFFKDDLSQIFWTVVGRG